MRGKGRDSSVGIATRYGPDGLGIESCTGEISAPIQTGPGAYPASYATSTGSFPGVKWPRRGVDHPPPRSSTEAKETLLLLAYKSCSRANFISNIKSEVTCPIQFLNRMVLGPS
jgi:hypothetical protein